MLIFCYDLVSIVQFDLRMQSNDREERWVQRLTGESDSDEKNGRNGRLTGESYSDEKNGRNG